MRGRLWLLGLLICAGCSRGPDLVVIHSPGQDNNTAGWCTQNGIAFTLKNNGDQPAPTDKLVWRPMEGTRSFREVFAHVAAEGNTETAMFGRPLPPGSLADFDAEEARLTKLPDDQLIAVMDRAMQSLSATLGGLSPARINSPIRYYAQSTLPRVATTYPLNDLHEHLGQLVAYARMNTIVPPWTRKG